MKKIFNGRNIAIAVITLAIGTFVALGASRLFFNSATTVSGNVVSFILNAEGKVDGALLDTGDQIKFGAETGEAVAVNLQIGSALTATGRAGTSSNYGREFHAQTLQIGDQTITIARDRKEPKGDRGDRSDRDGKHRPHPPRAGRKSRDSDRPLLPNDEMNNGKSLPPDAEMRDENAPANPRSEMETATVSGNVKFVLVNKDGEPRGLILASGEQLTLGREVENAGLSFDQNTSVSATGEIAKGQFGAFVRPKVLTVGNQTFTFDR